MGQDDRYEIRIAGFGGQGIVTIGKILGTAFSVYAGKNSVNTQSYGPESRGGACRSEVVVSDAEINYPYVRQAQLFVALSQVAYEQYIGTLKKGGVLLIDPEAVDIGTDSGQFRVCRVPVLELAVAAGNAKCQNAAALGGLSAILDGFLEVGALRTALEGAVPPKTVKANLLAFEMGRKHVLETFADKS